MISFLRQLILRDFWLKLFSLVLAILIWFTVSLAIRKEASPIAMLTGTSGEHTWHLFNIPVLVMSAAADVRDFKVTPPQVEVTVRGSTSALEQLQSSDVRALVDLTGIASASNLSKQIEVSTPPGITFVSVTPDQVQVIVPPKR